MTSFEDNVARLLEVRDEREADWENDDLRFEEADLMYSVQQERQAQREAVVEAQEAAEGGAVVTPETVQADMTVNGE